jgi:hypothetical protein
MPGPDVSSELVLPADLVADVSSWGDAWVDHAGDPRLSKLDFAWMAGLSKYGYWNVMPGGPLEKLEHPRFESMPIPNFLTLQTWVKLRLLAAREKGDFAAASAEVRQVARLCHSTELLIGAMVGINLLKAERRAYDAAVAAKADVRNWPMPYESEWLEDLRAVEWAGAGYVSVQLPEDVYEKARSVKAGRCAGLSEAAIYVLVRKRLDVDVPAWLAAELEKPEPPCRLELARWYLANGISPFEGTGPDAPSRTERIGIRLFPNTAIGLVESVATPEFFAKLEARPKAP